MGIPGLFKEIGKGDRIALTKLAIDHFEKHNRPLRIAIDAAIWNFQTQYGGQGGKNPALRTLYFRLLRLLALPIHPVFIYDGKNKPLTKRGKTVSRYGHCVPAELSKNLVARFQFPHHVAPGEAEAECAFLQKSGFVDAVMTQDVDALMFGSTLTLRDWSKEGTKGNKGPTHVSVLNAVDIKEKSGLDEAGMILVALLSGGDYHEGIPGFGPGLSCQIARAGFGAEMIDLVRQNNEAGLQEWRDRLQYEMESNESGYFQKRHKTLKIPANFPDLAVLKCYLEPAVSSREDARKLESRWSQWWDRDIDIPALRDYVAMTFDWLYKTGATYFIRSLAQPLFQHRLKTQQVSSEAFTTSHIKEQRKHFTTDGVSELRLCVVPAAVVNIDLNVEEENPEFAEIDADEDMVDEPQISSRDATQASSPSKGKRRPPWNPNAVEKWWVPEHLMRISLSGLTEQWYREQREIRADPLLFATRKCRPVTKDPKRIDKSMQIGAMNRFCTATEIGALPMADSVEHVKPSVKSARPLRDPFSRTKSNPLSLLSSHQTNIESHFRANKPRDLSKPIADESAEGDATHEPRAKACSGRAHPTLPTNSDYTLPHITAKTPNSTMAAEKPQRKSRMPARSYHRARTEPIVIDSETDTIFGDSDLPPSVTRRRERSAKHRSSLDMHTKAGTRDDFDSRVDNPTLPISSEAESRPPRMGSGRSVVAQDHAGDLGFSAATQKHLKQTVKSRDSLPGTWKAVPATPSQSRRIDFIDLTNT